MCESSVIRDCTSLGKCSFITHVVISRPTVFPSWCVWACSISTFFLKCTSCPSAMKRRRYVRRRGKRYARRRGLPKSFAWNELYRINPGQPKPLIAPGDAWVKRRVSRQFAATANTTYNFTTLDLWNAIAVGATGSGATQAVYPYAGTSRFQVRLSSIRLWARTAGKAFRVNWLETFLQQSETSQDPKSMYAYPASGVSFASIGIKIPTPQQVVIQDIGSSTTAGALFGCEAIDGTACDFFVVFSLKYKV